MAPAAPTIVSLKREFVSTQTRFLSQPINPTRAWRQSAEQDEDNLPEKAVDDALFRFNHRLLQHSRRVYPPQATHHIACQIDNLYLNAAAAAVAGRNEGGDDDAVAGLYVGADLADAEIIASLPPIWESEREVTAYPAEAKRYGELVAQLQSLSAQKQEATARVARLRQMKALLKAFNTTNTDDSGSNGVQENLVTRNGEVEAELQRMRMLLARVGGRVGQLPPADQSSGTSNYSLFADRELLSRKEEDVMDVEVDERRKVDQLLDLL